MNKTDFPWVSKVYPSNGNLQFFGYPSTNILVLGHPNSGNHWIRDILKTLKVEFASSHIASGNINTYTFLEIEQKILSNPHILNLRTSKNIFIYRDPKDVIISSFFTRKSNQTISKFLRCPKAGIERCIQFNLFFRNFLSNAYFIRYENIKTNTFYEINEFIKFLKLDISEDKISNAIEKCSFENMQKKEQLFKKYNNQDSDPESFKYRRGIVGGYVDYMSIDDIQYCNSLLEKYNYFENMR